MRVTLQDRSGRAKNKNTNSINIIIINTIIIILNVMRRMTKRVKVKVVIIIITNDKAHVRNMNDDVNVDNVDSVIDEIDMVW